MVAQRTEWMLWRYVGVQGHAKNSGSTKDKFAAIENLHEETCGNAQSRHRAMGLVALGNDRLRSTEHYPCQEPYVTYETRGLSQGSGCGRFHGGSVRISLDSIEIRRSR